MTVWNMVVGTIGLAAGLMVALWIWQPAAHATAGGPGFVGGTNLVPRHTQYPTVPMTHVASVATDKFKSSWSWYVSRASGILAAILLGLLVVSGIGMLTGHTYRLLEPLPAWAIHRALGIAFSFMVLVHIFVLLFDKYVGFSLADLLVPFASNYKPVDIAGNAIGLYMAMGVLAFYAIILIVLSSLLWMQRKPKPWRLLHYLSYFVLIMVFVHGLFMGTDLKNGLVRFLWLLGTVLIIVSITTRLRRADTIRRDN